MTIQDLKEFNHLCKQNKVNDLVNLISSNYKHINVLHLFELLIDDYIITFKDTITLQNNLVLTKEDFLFYEYTHNDYLPFALPTLDSLFNDALPFFPLYTKKIKNLPLKSYNELKTRQNNFLETIDIPFYKQAGEIIKYTFTKQETLNFILNFINFHEDVIYELMYLGCKHFNLSIRDYDICTPKDILQMIEIHQKYERKLEEEH